MIAWLGCCLYPSILVKCERSSHVEVGAWTLESSQAPMSAMRYCWWCDIVNLCSFWRFLDYMIGNGSCYWYKRILQPQHRSHKHSQSCYLDEIPYPWFGNDSVVKAGRDLNGDFRHFSLVFLRIWCEIFLAWCSPRSSFSLLEPIDSKPHHFGYLQDDDDARLTWLVTLIHSLEIFGIEHHLNSLTT
jgi:hypothetical protein